jgi:alpha-D-ribose 1-methylphosphonate 5-triphosphate synthase subunit PhnG
MAKVRTTIALSEVSHQWLRARTRTTGEMAEYLEALIQKERTLGPIEARLQRQADQLDRIMNQTNQARSI